MEKDRLFTGNFYKILAANFLLYIAFYLILPILPFYLVETYNTDKTMIGVILSCYTIACLCIRPFSGYLLDTFSRRPLYLLAYFVFIAIFGGYMIATTITLFLALRVVHGFAFGMVTVAGNTIVIDIMPSSRRGEGLGYYGLANNLAMSFGPMIGLFMHQGLSYQVIFSSSLIVSMPRIKLDFTRFTIIYSRLTIIFYIITKYIWRSGIILCSSYEIFITINNKIKSKNITSNNPIFRT